MCTKNLHVDIWPWVIGHGELESGVYFDRGGRRAARFGFFSLPRRAAQRQCPAWFTAAAFSGCLWPSRAARRALKRACATAAVLGGPPCPRTRRAAQGALWHCRAVLTFGWRRGRLGAYCNHNAKLPMCNSILHVDVWPWVIGHGELESGVYLF